MKVKNLLSIISLLLAINISAQLMVENRSQARRTHDQAVASFLFLSEQAQLRDMRAWNHLFSDMKKDGIEEVIIEWLQYDGAPSDYIFILGKILRASHKYDIRVIIGLSASKGWWGDERQSDRYLDDEVQKTLRVAERVYRLINGHPSFEGWYIPYEMEALPIEAKAKDRIIRFYRKISSFLKRLTPEKVIAISGYKQRVVPREFDAVNWWHDLLTSSGINRFYYQDGYGVRRDSPLETSNRLLNNLAKGQSSREFELWVVIETFEEVIRPIGDDHNFIGISTSTSRLCQQVRQAKSLGLAVALYTYDEFMFKAESIKARRLRDGWRQSNRCGQILPQ